MLKNSITDISKPIINTPVLTTACIVQRQRRAPLQFCACFYVHCWDLRKCSNFEPKLDMPSFPIEAPLVLCYNFAEFFQT